MRTNAHFLPQLLSHDQPSTDVRLSSRPLLQRWLPAYSGLCLHGSVAQTGDRRAVGWRRRSSGRGARQRAARDRAARILEIAEEQGDAIRIYNTVRLVRGGDVTETAEGDPDANSTVPEVDPSNSSSPAQTMEQSAPNDQPGEPSMQQHPDFAVAAAELSLTEEALQAALGNPSQGPPDFVAAAATLGVTEKALLAAMGTAGDGGPMPGGQPPMNTP